MNNIKDDRSYFKVLSREPLSDIVDARKIADYCRIEDGYDLDEIRVMGLAAAQYCEEYTGSFLTDAVISQYLEGFRQLYNGGSIPKILLTHRSKSVSKVTAVEENGSEVSIPFTFNDHNNTVLLDYDRYLLLKDIKIEYVSGYPDDQPPILAELAIRLLVNTMFESRSEDVYGINVSRGSMKVERLLSPLKNSYGE